jgi:hypothetical protein
MECCRRLGKGHCRSRRAEQTVGSKWYLCCADDLSPRAAATSTPKRGVTGGASRALDNVFGKHEFAKHGATSSISMGPLGPSGHRWLIILETQRPKTRLCALERTGEVWQKTVGAARTRLYGETRPLAHQALSHKTLTRSSHATSLRLVPTSRRDRRCPVGCRRVQRCVLQKSRAALGANSPVP